MFIGHVPAGYLCTRGVWSLCFRNGLRLPPWRSFLIVGMVCSVLPDTDLAFFYLIDHRQHMHHSYWTHVPVYWIGMGLVGLLGITVLDRRRLVPYLVVAEANLMLHFFLDTIVGKIRWLYPLSDREFFLFEIPRVHTWWVLDFVLHWTFSLEIALWIVALYVFTLSGHEETADMVDTDKGRRSPLQKSGKVTPA